ncbi:FtsX-like permease family protein [Frigoribacterium sp. R86507]|uniref:FtsX-like permease family protein n=1 Tax=Frigoribacterium sp. R86507 TaxID=3093850 RepID=UPI0037C76835
MIARLVVADLVAGWRTWLGVFVVLFLSGVVALVCAGDVSTARAMDDPQQAAALMNHAKIYSAMNGLVVVAGVALLVGYAVRLQRTRHALWQFAGLTPRSIAAVVLAQVATVSVLAFLVASIAVLPVLDLLLNGLSRPVRADPDAPLVSIALSPGPVAVAALVHVGVAVVSAAVAARRAGRTPALVAVRAPLDETVRPGVGRFVATALAAVLAVGTYVGYLLGDRGVTSLFPIAFIALFAAVAPWLTGPVMRLWTAVLPAGVGTTWFVARRNALHAVARSQAAVALLAIAAALGAFTGAIGVWSDLRMFVQGLALFGVPVAVVLLTAGTTIFMATPERRRESAVLVVAGMTWRAVTLAAAIEAVVVTVTAGLLAMALALPATIVPLPGQQALDSLRPLPWVLLVGFVLVVVLSIAPVLAARRRPVVRELGVAA